MPLRHFIVLIANAHRLCWIWSACPFSLALKGRPNLTIRSSYLCRIRHDPENFPRPAMRDYLLQSRFLTMPSTCSIGPLYGSYAEQLSCGRSLRPASRD
jgi:hypothetical protein